MTDLTKLERERVSYILRNVANEIAAFNDEYRRNTNYLGSVERALTREIDRMRKLAERVLPPGPDEDE